MLGLVIGLVAVGLWIAPEDPAAATAALPTQFLGSEIDGDVVPQIVGGWFAKYEGIDGESNDELHEGWLDILGYEWGLATSASAPSSIARRRSPAEVNDLYITFAYEKAAPKLLEKTFKGQVIPTVEMELTTNFGEVDAVYLRYEMTNVMLTSYEVGGYADGGPPTVVVGHSFEEIKVTYTEFDEEGSSQGNVETELNLESGR